MISDTKKKRPKDPIELAKLIGDIAIGEVEDKPEKERNLVAINSGRKGGVIGGKIRAERLTPEERKTIANKAIKTRWNKDKE